MTSDRVDEAPLEDILVLGLGNVLLGDDGLGETAVRLFEETHGPFDRVRILDGGTLGLSLLPYLQEARAAILVDAIRADRPAGTLVRLTGDEVAPAVATRLSVHQIGVADLLDAARLAGNLPRELVLLGLVPESIELRLGLSAPVARGVPGLLEALADELARLCGLRVQGTGRDDMNERPPRPWSAPRESAAVGV